MDGDTVPQVTPEMVQAGREILWESGLLPFGNEGLSGEIITIREIYEAMQAAAPRNDETKLEDLAKRVLRTPPKPRKPKEPSREKPKE